jgi:hypothetical protein
VHADGRCVEHSNTQVGLCEKQYRQEQIEIRDGLKDGSKYGRSVVEDEERPAPAVCVLMPALARPIVAVAM